MSCLFASFLQKKLEEDDVQDFERNADLHGLRMHPEKTDSRSQATNQERELEILAEKSGAAGRSQRPRLF